MSANFLYLQATIASYEQTASILSAKNNQSASPPLLLAVSPLASSSQVAAEHSTYCRMSTCFNWTTCPPTAHLHVCTSGALEAHWQHALLMSPHFTPSCSNACLKVVFSPDACGDGMSCLHVGGEGGNSSHIKAGSVLGLLRPGYDFLLLRHTSINQSGEMPMIARRSVRWLLGASLGSTRKEEVEGREDLLQALRRNTLGSNNNPINVKLTGASLECGLSEGSNFGGWAPCSDADDVGAFIYN